MFFLLSLFCPNTDQISFIVINVIWNASTRHCQLDSSINMFSIVLILDSQGEGVVNFGRSYEKMTLELGPSCSLIAAERAPKYSINSMKRYKQFQREEICGGASILPDQIIISFHLRCQFFHQQHYYFCLNKKSLAQTIWYKTMQGNIKGGLVNYFTSSWFFLKKSTFLL